MKVFSLSDKHIVGAIVILFLVIIRLPLIFTWNKYMTGNDAAIYMKKAINLADGRGLSSSICRHINDKDKLDDYVSKFGNREQELRIAPLYIYSISLLYMMFGINNFMVSINIFNLLLFIMFLLLLYYQLNKEYPDRFVPVITIIIVGVNYTMYRLTYAAHMEYMSILLFTACYVMHSKIISNDDNHIVRPTIIYGILLSLLFLSKYSTIPFIGAFVLQHIVKKKKSANIILLSVIIMIAGLWFIIRPIILDGRVISDFEGQSFPFSKNVQVSTFKSFMIAINSKAQFIDRFIHVILGYNGLSLLFPFAALYVFTKTKNNKSQLMILLLACAIPFYFYYGHIEIRYIYPILLIYIPVSINEIYKYLIYRKVGNCYLIIVLLMSMYMYTNIYSIINYNWITHKKSIDRESIFIAANELIEKNGVYDKVILTNIIGYCVYSINAVVQAPKGINHTNKYEVLETYMIDYVLYADDQKNRLARWDQNVVPKDIFTDYELVDVSENDDRVRLYRVPENREDLEAPIRKNKK